MSTPARIVALAVIGLLVFGLAYVRFAPSCGPVSVPAGAKAGDLTLHSCTYATEQSRRPPVVPRRHPIASRCR